MNSFKKIIFQFGEFTWNCSCSFSALCAVQCSCHSQWIQPRFWIDQFAAKGSCHGVLEFLLLQIWQLNCHRQIAIASNSLSNFHHIFPLKGDILCHLSVNKHLRKNEDSHSAFIHRTSKFFRKFPCSISNSVFNCIFGHPCSNLWTYNCYNFPIFFFSTATNYFIKDLLFACIKLSFRFR